MNIEDNNWNLQEGIIVRAYMPLGYYPKKALIHRDSSFVLDKKLIFSAARFKVVEIEEYYIEKEWIIPKEIKLLSSIALSVDDEKGKVYAYPHPMSYKIKDIGYDLSDIGTLSDFKSGLLQKLKDAKCSFWQTCYPPPALGGPEYQINENADDLSRQLEIYNAIALEDHLLIRGLGAFLKGDLLSVHHIFHTEACISLHIAMEATLQIILRRLRKKIHNPSNKDASEYICEVFQSQYTPEHYFEDYYTDRIVAVHPSNRIGTFPDAPLSADDFYDLYEQLRSVYDFLITGRVREFYKGN
jgi:hypothetical protein